jgi:cell wall-associated NlpC family hydrolase
MKKNLLTVSVALSVFTVTSLTSFAQPKREFNSNNKELNYNNLPSKYIPENKIEEQNSAEIVTELCTPFQFKYAQIIDSEVESISNDSYLFNFIDEWWGVRYRYGGTTKRGVDCSSYTGQLFYSVYGLSLPRTAREQYAQTNRVTRTDLHEGDFVFFNTRGGISHVGVYLYNGYFTHSSSSSGVTISNLNEVYYAKRFVSGGRVKENNATQLQSE